MLTALAFLTDEAAKSIRRNGLMSVTALSTVTISLAVFGGAVYGLYRMHQLVTAQPERFHIAAFYKLDVPRADAIETGNRIRQLPGVADVQLVSREKALAEMRLQDHLRATRVVAALGGANPLPDRLDIRVTDPSRTRRVSDLLSDQRRFPEIECIRDEADTLDRLIATSDLVRNVGAALAVLMLIATSMVVQNTLRLTVMARADAIAIMRLVGATPSFIRLPLVLEGLFHGVVGAVVAGLLVLVVAAQSSLYVGRFRTPLAETIPAAPQPMVVLAALVATGAALGLITSALAIRRFLK